VIASLQLVNLYQNSKLKFGGSYSVYLRPLARHRRKTFVLFFNKNALVFTLIQFFSKNLYCVKMIVVNNVEY